MTTPPVTSTIAPDDPLERALVEAIKGAAGPTPTTCIVVLPAATRPGRELIEIITREAAALARGSEIVLVHPSASLGFLISSAALRVPHVRISHRSTPFDRQSEADGSARAASGVLARASTIEAAFSLGAFRGDGVCVIDLVAESRSARVVAEEIEACARRYPMAKKIYLVDPKPIAGFIASTLSLRLPLVSVIAVASASLVST